MTVRKPVLQRGSKVVSLGSVLEDREGDQVTRGGCSSVDSEIGVGRVSADGRFLEGEEGRVRETCESDERKLVSASAGHKWMGCAEGGRENLGAGRGADGYHSATTTSCYRVLQYAVQRIELTRPPRACTTFTGVESRFSRSIACVQLLPIALTSSKRAHSRLSHVLEEVLQRRRLASAGGRVDVMR